MQKYRIVGINLLVAVTVLMGLLSGVTIGLSIAVMKDLPQIRELENFESSAVTRFLSADRVLLAEVFLERRTPIPFERIPANLKAALIATEDRQFYAHSGIDLKGIMRAIVKDIMAGEFVEGASTITQQLAKTLFLTPEKKLTRKIKEALLAIQMERRYTKNEILTLYLNQIYLGSGTYGVESAAQRYFGLSTSQLNLSQSALIAGLPKAPSRYSPLINPELAEKRRNLVLRIMRDQGLITQIQYAQALQEPVSDLNVPKAERSASYFIDMIKPEIEAIIGPSLLYKGGLTIHTTLSHRMQKAAERAVKKGLDRIHKRQGLAPQRKDLLQGALVAINVRTGGIEAMVGGRAFSQSAFNRAVKARRQCGSAFKPLVYALAITRGYTQASLLLDSPVVFRGGQKGKDWQPKNFSGDYQGEITLRYSLTQSKNIPTVRLAEQLGPSALVDFSHRLGIESPLLSNLSLSLGSANTTLLEMVSAYAAFANQGNHISPYGVTEILDRDETTIWRARPAVRPSISPEQAAIVVDMLKGAICGGTGSAACNMSIPVAGKTGTTNDFKDALFIGFSPEIAAGVWVGMDDFSPLGDQETGAHAALPVWIEFMNEAHGQLSIQAFQIPDNTVYQWLDPFTGHVTDQKQTGFVRALFIKGTQAVPE